MDFKFPLQIVLQCAKSDFGFDTVTIMAETGDMPVIYWSLCSTFYRLAFIVHIKLLSLLPMWINFNTNIIACQ